MIGKPFVMHANPDDMGLGGQPLSNITGNAGGRIACGASKALPLQAVVTMSPNGLPCDSTTPCGSVVVTQVILAPTVCHAHDACGGFHFAVRYQGHARMHCAVVTFCLFVGWSSFMSLDWTLWSGSMRETGLCDNVLSRRRQTR